MKNYRVEEVYHCMKSLPEYEFVLLFRKMYADIKKYHPLEIPCMEEVLAGKGQEEIE